MCHCAGRSLARVCPQARPDSVCAETLRGWVWVPTCPAEQGTRGSCREGGTKGRRHGHGVPVPSDSEGFAVRPAPCTPFFPGSQPRVQRAQQPCHQRRLPLRRQPPHLHGRQGHEHHAVAGHLVPAGAPGSRAGPGRTQPRGLGPCDFWSVGKVLTNLRKTTPCAAHPSRVLGERHVRSAVQVSLLYNM